MSEEEDDYVMDDYIVEDEVYFVDDEDESDYVIVSNEQNSMSLRDMSLSNLDKASKKLFKMDFTKISDKFRIAYSSILTDYKQLLSNTSHKCALYLRVIAIVNNYILKQNEFDSRNSFMKAVCSQLELLDIAGLESTIQSCQKIEKECVNLIRTLLSESMNDPSCVSVMRILFSTLALTVKYSYTVYGLLLEGAKDLKFFERESEIENARCILEENKEDARKIREQLLSILSVISTNVVTLDKISEVLSIQYLNMNAFANIIESASFALDELKKELKKFQKKTNDLNAYN